ncbi:MAG: outer membrane beta-barrel protein [Candidatus Acidiferrales bacterium]|jgi:outer membrane immunogenic protein
MRKFPLASSALIAVLLSAPALAATDSQAEISALKAEVQQLAAEVAELKKQQTTQVTKVDQLQTQEMAQDSKVEQLQKQEATQAQEPSIEPTAASGTHDWSGPYVGANVGAGMASGTVADKDSTSIASADIFSEAFAQGGLHAGYNYQIKNTVLGVEAEANLGSQDHKGNLDASSTADVMFTKSQIDWSAALLGRAGIAVGDSLFFMDAGPAIAHLSGISNAPGALGLKWSVDTWTPGIKGGVGAEFMVTPDISLRAQYSVLAVAQESVNPSVNLSSSCSQTGICHNVWANMQQTATVGADWHF